MKPAEQTEAFTCILGEAYPDTCGYMTREPKSLADALDARGLPGDHELAEVFRNFGDILPHTLQRMSFALAAINAEAPHE